VDNWIKVRPGTPSDRTIADYVEDAIGRDPYLERYQVDVTVVDGEVYLYGEVDSTYEKAHADDVAARQVGVTAVHNYLDINDPVDVVYDYDPYVDRWSIYDYDWYSPSVDTTTESDWEILEEINDELWWSPFVDSDAVTVTVDDGVATLTGTVDTWNEREAATENAYEGGAIAVDNDLAVEYGPEYYWP
jgi:osmotically-inducible protein OsmY